MLLVAAARDDGFGCATAALLFFRCLFQRLQTLGLLPALCCYHCLLHACSLLIDSLFYAYLTYALGGWLVTVLCDSLAQAP
jgi:hypothetical protein